MLLEAVVVAAFGAGVAEAAATAGLVGGVVLVVALGGGPPADRAGAGGVPDLGQVPELDSGVVGPAFMLVVAGVGGDRVDRDDQVPAGSGGTQSPGAISAPWRPVPTGGSEAEPRRAGSGAFAKMA